MELRTRIKCPSDMDPSSIQPAVIFTSTRIRVTLRIDPEDGLGSLVIEEKARDAMGVEGWVDWDPKSYPWKALLADLFEGYAMSGAAAGFQR